MIRSIKTSTLILLGILLIAGFFRFWQLDSIPPGLYPDVAINGNEAITNPGQVFYPENNGREGLFINLIALSFGLFGISVWSIKVVAAFFGTLTVLGTYLLTKELFSTPKSQITNHKSQTNPNDQNLKSQTRVSNLGFRNLDLFGIWSLEFGVSRSELIALLSSFFLATSFWHINFSRLGFRAILLPFILVFSFWFLWAGFRTKNLPRIIFGGFLFGLGFYTYTSFRMAVLLLAVFLFLWWLIYRKDDNTRKFLFFSFYLLFVIFITALPIGIYFLQHPADFASRAAPISIFAQENLLKAFGESFVRHMAMFNIYGDPNWRHNFAGSPQLLWPVGILFLIGIGIAIERLIKLRVTIYDLRFARNIFLLAWLLIMLLPGALTYEGLPHALRVIGVIPAVYILAAVGGWELYQWLSCKNIHKKLLLFFVIFFLIIIAFAEFNKYFIAWSKNLNVEGAFTKHFAEIGKYLNSLPILTQKYIIVNEPGTPVPFPDGLPMPVQTVMFIERTAYGMPMAKYLKPEELDRTNGVTNFVVIPMRPDDAIFAQLQQKFPGGKTITENNLQVFKMPF